MKISLSSLSYLFVPLSLLVLSLSRSVLLCSLLDLSFTSWAQQAPGSVEWPAEDAAPEPASARPLLRGGVLLPPGPVILGSPLVVASSAWTTSVGSCCCLERARSGGGDDAELATASSSRTDSSPADSSPMERSVAARTTAAGVARIRGSRGRISSSTPVRIWRLRASGGSGDGPSFSLPFLP
jgi:hypothetical protein